MRVNLFLSAILLMLLLTACSSKQNTGIDSVPADGSADNQLTAKVEQVDDKGLLGNAHAESGIGADFGFETALSGTVQIHSGDTVELGSAYASDPVRKTVSLVSSEEYPGYSQLCIGDCKSSILLMTAGTMYLDGLNTADQFIIVQEDDQAGHKSVAVFKYEERNQSCSLALIGRLDGELENIDHNVITTYGIDRETFAGANAFYRHKEYVLAVGDVSEKERIRFYGSNEDHYSKDGAIISDFAGSDEQCQFDSMVSVPTATVPVGQMYRTLCDTEVFSSERDIVSIPAGTDIILVSVDDKDRLNIVVPGNKINGESDVKGFFEYHYKDGEMILCNDLSFDAVFGGKGW